MTRSETIKFLALRTVGNFLVLFAIFGVIATFGPSVFYEVQYRIAQIRGIEYSVAQAEEVNQTSPLGELIEQDQMRQSGESQSFADVLAGPKEQIITPKNTEFSIVIPKLGASAQVFPNVDPNNETEFLEVLRHGVAHAKGSVFPGLNGNTYLFAHSADNFWNAGRYNAIFYLLKDLQVGDEIIVFFENKRHNYTVTSTQIVDPNQVDALVNAQKGDKEQLILQTCWPPGTTWKRLLVTAEPQ